jgi:PEP-CTERM motif
MRFLRGLLVGGALIAVASASSAVPVVYTFTSGSVTLTATVSGTGVAGPVVIPLTGTSVTLDQGALYLNSISFAIGSTPSIAISPNYAGFTSIHIDFATLTGTGGTLIPLIPSVYDYSIGPVNVAGQFDAVNLNPINNINNAPFGFINPSASGTIFVGLGQIDLDGITLGQIDADGPLGPIPPLILKGDFTFTGVPEPGTALLLGMGLAGFAALRRRSPRA